MTVPRRPFAALALALAPGLLFAGCTSTTSKAGNEVFERGLRQAEGGDVEAAIETLSKGVKSHPGHTRMRFQLSRLQYERGEAFHLEECRLDQDAAAFLEQGNREDALANRRKANELRAKATPYYQAARVNLRRVVGETDDDALAGWAYYLLMRVDVFFEDWDQAHRHMDRAIELGKPSGPQLAQMRKFMASLKAKSEPKVGY